MNPAVALDFAKRLVEPGADANLTEITKYMFERKILPERAAERVVNYLQSNHMTNGSLFSLMMAAYYNNDRIPSSVDAMKVLINAQETYRAGKIDETRELLFQYLSMPAKIVTKEPLDTGRELPNIFKTND